MRRNVPSGECGHPGFGSGQGGFSGPRNYLPLRSVTKPSGGSHRFGCPRHSVYSYSFASSWLAADQPHHVARKVGGVVVDAVAPLDTVRLIYTRLVGVLRDRPAGVLLQEQVVPVPEVLGGGTPRRVAHPYELYLALNEIEHRRTLVRRPQTNGFVERFNRTVLDEFFREAFRERFYDSVEALQQDLDRWRFYYNTERPHQGYRNQGRRPVETLELYVNRVAEAA